MRTKILSIIFALGIFFTLANKTYAAVGYCTWQINSRGTTTNFTVNSCSPTLTPSNNYNLQLFDTAISDYDSDILISSGSGVLSPENIMGVTHEADPQFLTITDASDSAVYWVTNTDTGATPTPPITPVYVDIASQSALANGIHDLAQIQFNEFLILIVAFGIIIGGMWYFLS